MLASLGFYHASLGDPEAAFGYFREAKLLDPSFEPRPYSEALAVTHFVARQYGEAIDAFGRVTTGFWSIGYLAACQALADRVDIASTYAAETLRLAPAFSAVRFVAKEPFKRLEDRELLLEGLRKAGLPD